MPKSLPVASLALALALSGGAATPARADDDDIAKALAAIAAIAIIGAAIENRNDRRPVAPPPRLEPLPSDCVFEYWGANGPDHALSARCLARELRHPDRLPGSCRTQVRVMPWQDRNQNSHSRHGQMREAYDISCLYRAGYRFDH